MVKPVLSRNEAGILRKFQSIIPIIIEFVDTAECLKGMVIAAFLLSFVSDQSEFFQKVRIYWLSPSPDGRQEPY